MNNKNFQTFFDCGFSKIRAGIFNENNQNEAFYAESKSSIDRSSLKKEVQKIITTFENDTNEYIDNVNLMIDSPKMLSIGISISKKLDVSKLREINVQFLIQEAKQQILKHYSGYNIAHIIINNYKIDNHDYSYFPNQINCHFISLDIIFICLPDDLVQYFKNIFLESNILINKIICSSYAKSINYKNNLNLTNYVSFIDVGFNKTSIFLYFNDKILSLITIPIGGNHITKDISKILKIDLEKAENIKINYKKNMKSLNENDLSAETVQKIISARIQEILELSYNSIKSNNFTKSQFRIILMGEGLKAFDKKRTDLSHVVDGIDLLQDSCKNICQAGFKSANGLNKQEVVVIPKKQIKQGFFEKLFHFFG
ncbi:cell division protein FtsA [Candidatus Pelagibacter sp.]|nr:cell division protein FtsA [Candidatus Pelagibacter sp.]